jgi:hypothetical protein
MILSLKMALFNKFFIIYIEVYNIFWKLLVLLRWLS